MLTEQELAQRHALWREFRERWPIERVRAMTLEEYTNLEKDDSFTYWIEAKLVELGSIWGMSSFKFGIYRQAEGKGKESTTTHTYGTDYAWWTRRGDTAEDAFASVRDSIVTVAESAAAGDLEAIDAVDLTSLYKWKIAFLYQDPSAPRIFPIYSQHALLDLYRRYVDAAGSKRTPLSVVYATLRDRFSDISDPIQLGHHLWALHEQEAPDASLQSWALTLPVGGELVDAGMALALQADGLVSTEGLPASIADSFSEAGARPGDRIAVVYGDRVRARGKLEEVGDGEVSWKQETCTLDWRGERALGLWRLSDRDAARIWTETDASVSSVSLPVEAAPPPRPRNIVLYGPPGTGKTYATTRRALQLVLGEEAVASMSDDTAAKQLRQLQQQGRVEIVTFHQAYGYEELVEGLRPVLGEGGTGEVRYELHDGVFKRMALQAAAAGLRAPVEEPSFDVLWAELVRRVRADEDRVFQSSSGKEYVLRVTARDNFESYAFERDDAGESLVTDRRQIASRTLSELWWMHRQELGRPEELSYERAQQLIRREHGGGGGHHYSPLWIVYKQLLALRDEMMSARASARPTAAQVVAAMDRASPGKVDFAYTAKTSQFVLIIDEINRGNVSKILGELITLLEPDKRLGMPNELKLPLAYSPEHRFAVPPNLHVLATMNTADRSIALMDVALRRRFEFEEVMPSVATVRAVLGKRVSDSAFVDLVSDMLETLNARIRFLYDADHQIGHAYFLEATDYASLRNVMVDRVIPLLREYFYGSWDKIAAVLGCPYDDEARALRRESVAKAGRYSAPMIDATVTTAEDVLGFDHEAYEGVVEHRVSEAFRSARTAAELAPFFIGLLNGSAADHEARLAQLRAGEAFTAGMA